MRILISWEGALMSSMYNRFLKLSIFGESHGDEIGMVLDNLPSGEKIDRSELLQFISRRTAKPGDHYSTARTEPDLPQFLSGILHDCTTGTPLAAVIKNTNTRSQDYGEMQHLARPGHADYTGYVRYHGANDIRGGGHFSGRLTAPFVLAGGICKQILERRGIFCASHIYSIKDVVDSSFPETSIPAELISRLHHSSFPLIDQKKEASMKEVIEKARLDCDSVGGIVECAVSGLPCGIGSPMFDGIENILASLIFAIPAVKGLEFGNGFSSTYCYGSENNDEFYMQDDQVKTYTNHHGGILGGISSGMPILFKVAFKPTPSIAKPQRTIDYKKQTDAIISIQGRHDPCIVPRAAVVVEAVANIAILDLCLEHHWIQPLK